VRSLVLGGAKRIGYDSVALMHVLTGIAVAVFGIVLTIVWLVIMLAALMVAVSIVAELVSLIAGAAGGRERSRAAGW